MEPRLLASYQNAVETLAGVHAAPADDPPTQACLPWRPAISAATVLAVVRRTASRHHSSVPLGQRRQSGSRVQRRISLRSLSVRRWPPRLRSGGTIPRFDDLFSRAVHQRFGTLHGKLNGLSPCPGWGRFFALRIMPVRVCRGPTREARRGGP